MALSVRGRCSAGPDALERPPLQTGRRCAPDRTERRSEGAAEPEVRFGLGRAVAGEILTAYGPDPAIGSGLGLQRELRLGFRFQPARLRAAGDDLLERRS